MFRKKRPLTVWVLTLLFLLSAAGIAGAATVDNSQPTGVKVLFSDLNNTDKNTLYIKYMANRGLINGFPDGTYHPGEGLTRAQAAVLFCRIKGLNPAKKDSTFSDLAGSQWAAGYISAAVRAGYITGFPDGTYRPQAILTRAQGINLFLQLATEKDNSEEPPALQDLDKNHWAANSLAIALTAGMIEAEGNRIKPEQPFARGDLARALGILLTKDPGLNQQELIGELKVKNGTVELKRAGSEKLQTANTTSIVRKGDTVITGKDGEAEICYPDGSGILLKPNSQIIVKTSIGRAYIVKGGNPGTAVEDLQVELTNGKLFGALASQYTGTEQTESAAKETAANNKYSKIASRDNNFGLLAAKTSEQPWYKTAEKKKIRVKVDMPWGVAAIRGSFWSNYTSSSGSCMSLLHGDGSLSSGGQTQNLSPGQSSSSGSSGGPPSHPGAMSPSEAREWTQQRDWVGERAGDMRGNQGAGDPGSEGQDQGDNQGNDPSSDTLTDTLNQSLNQAAQTAASAPSGGSEGSGGSRGGDTTPAQGTIMMNIMTDSFILPVSNPPDSIGSGTMPFTVSPACAAVTYALSGDDVLELSVYGGGTSERCVYINSKSTTGTACITFTASAAGYSSVTHTITVNVVELANIEPGYLTPGYSPATLTIWPTGQITSDTDQVSIKLFSEIGMEEINNRISNINLCQEDGIFITFDLAAGIEEGEYYFVIYKDSCPVALAPFAIKKFKLDSLILCYGLAPGRDLMPNDILYFFFNSPVNPESINIPGLLPGGGAVGVEILASDGTQYTKTFSDLGLGDFVTSFSASDLSSNPVIQGQATLTSDGKMLEIDLQGDPGSGHFTLASGLFTPAAGIKDINNNPISIGMVGPTSASVSYPSWGSAIQGLASITGTAASNLSINNVAVQLWYNNDGTKEYLQPDGIGGWLFTEGEYAIAAAESASGWSTWSLPLDAMQQEAITAKEGCLFYIDVFISSGRVGSTIRHLSSFTIDTTAPQLAIAYPFDPPNGEVCAVNADLLLYFTETVIPTSGKYIYIRKSDDSLFETIAAASALIETNAWGESTVKINPSGTFANGSNYYIQIDPGAFVDRAGNPYAGITDSSTWSFTANN